MKIQKIPKLVQVPLDEIAKQEKLLFNFKSIKNIADHYNIYKDLFEHAYFVPALDLNVSYSNVEDGLTLPVYYGNKMTAKSVLFLFYVLKRKRIMF